MMIKPSSDEKMIERRQHCRQALTDTETVLPPAQTSLRPRDRVLVQTMEHLRPQYYNTAYCVLISPCRANVCCLEISIAMTCQVFRKHQHLNLTSHLLLSRKRSSRCISENKINELYFVIKQIIFHVFYHANYQSCSTLYVY